jgi:broad specificity phosphatase PhoE
VNLGLWEGLTFETLRERYGKAYRQWQADPLSVEPPEGEEIGAAEARLLGALTKIAKKRTEPVVALVLGRLLYATARCALLDGNYESFWEYVDPSATPEIVKCGVERAGNSAEVEESDGERPPPLPPLRS